MSMFWFKKMYSDYVGCFTGKSKMKGTQDSVLFLQLLVNLKLFLRTSKYNNNIFSTSFEYLKTISQNLFLRTTVMHHWMMGICSEKCIIRRFHLCENIIGYIYINLDGIADCTPSLYGTNYCSKATRLSRMLPYWIL